MKRLAEITALIRADAPNLALTIDFVEHRGFDYHTGVAFSLFAAGHDRELGHGGRYRAPALDRDNGEPAVGFSLFMDAVEAAAPKPEPPVRVYTPTGMSAEDRQKVQALGYVTVRALGPDAGLCCSCSRIELRAYWRGDDVIFLKDE